MERQYKDSGIEWIGRIPKEWKTCKLNYVYRFQTGATPPTNNEVYFDGNIKWASIADLKSKVINDTAKTLSKEGVEKCSMSISPKGSLMYSFKLSVGIVSFCGEDMYTNEAIATFLNGYGYLPFLYYMAPLAIIQNANYNIYGAPILNQELIKGATIIVPPLPEQQQIVEFLDKKCSEIDSLIALQEQMIAQLTDYKQSVITEAVTKGLNPDAQLAPSGIDWIDTIPKGWKNVRFYYSNWIRGRLGWKGLKSEEYTESGYPFLSAFNIINNKLDWSDINYINLERYDESPEIKLNEGDILLVKDGAGIGKCARIDELPLGESTVNSSLAVITPKAFLNYKYLYYYLQSNSFWSIINLLLVGMGVPHLTQTNMKNIKMPLPPLEEQVAIAEYLDTKCGEIDRLIETKRQKIETLKEYKKSVIYEAVTGKTDLRDS